MLGNGLNTSSPGGHRKFRAHVRDACSGQLNEIFIDRQGETLTLSSKCPPIRPYRPIKADSLSALAAPETDWQPDSVLAKRP